MQYHPTMLLPVLFSLIPLTVSHGYLEIRLKSAFPLNATIEIAEDIYFPTNKRTWHVPLMPGEAKLLTNIPVAFHRPGTVLVNSGPVGKFGLQYATIRSDRWNTQQMTIVSEKMHLPFTGFRIDVKCFRNWHGPYCDSFCNDDLAKLINRRCTQYATLGCPKHFFGVKCDKEIDYNAAECQCENGGICVSSFPTDKKTDGIICECPLGFEGDKCEKEQYEYAVPLSLKWHGSAEGKVHKLAQLVGSGMVENELFEGDTF